ncbi:MAG: thiol:disulfide interchange protein [Acidobacteria bacterium]|nr:MAG: thiol:disulfide interchange protein [Acidobacteriota bacterium]
MNSPQDLLNHWSNDLRILLEPRLQTFSLLAYLIVFAAGVLTSFTPCVYPMIPVTVTYIGGAQAGSKKRAALRTLVYVLGIALVYSALGAFAALSKRFFGQIATNPWITFGVGNVIILFGLSMLDAVVIPVPGILTRGAKGGENFLGALVMGMASGFVAAPCTAPVLGTLLIYVGSSGNVLYGASLLFTFAFGLGFLLLLLGTFAGALASLPKAGSWMVTIKKVFGFGMILVGEYFLIQTGKLILRAWHSPPRPPTSGREDLRWSERWLQTSPCRISPADASPWPIFGENRSCRSWGGPVGAPAAGRRSPD